MKRLRKDKHPAPRVQPWLGFAARFIIAPLLCRIYKARGINKELFTDLAGPYVIVSNHTTFFDPVLIAGVIRKPIQYIVTDSLLQGVLGRIIKWTGVIPLTKGKPDNLYLRDLFAVRDAGNIIGLFPEAQTTWDGSSNSIYTTAVKVIKKMGLPIYGAKVEGGYLKEPKWAASVRKGEIIIRFKKLADPEELRGIDPEVLLTRISHYISNDDPRERKKEGRSYPSKRGAEYLERFLFSCCKCGSMDGHLVSRKNRLLCGACGSSWNYNSYGELTDEATREVISLKSWNKGQTEQLRQFLDQSVKRGVFPPDHVAVRTGYRRNRRRKLGCGTLSAEKNGFVFRGHRTMRFPYEGITGCAMVTADYFEFYFENTLYDFCFLGKRGNGLKYLRIMQIVNPGGAELN